jgi:hypothetical protein
MSNDIKNTIGYICYSAADVCILILDEIKTEPIFQTKEYLYRKFLLDNNI